MTTKQVALSGGLIAKLSDHGYIELVSEEPQINPTYYVQHDDLMKMLELVVPALSIDCAPGNGPVRRYYVSDEIPRSHLLISSALVLRGPGHDRLQVWNRGANAGTLTVGHGDGYRIAALLLPGFGSRLKTSTGDETHDKEETQHEETENERLNREFLATRGDYDETRLDKADDRGDPTRTSGNGG